MHVAFQRARRRGCDELATWPGVRIERRSDGAAQVLYERSQLGVLYPDRGAAEVLFLKPEHDELIEHGEGKPAQLTPESRGVSHDIHGPWTSQRCSSSSTADTAMSAARRTPTAPKIPHEGSSAADARRAPEPARFLTGHGPATRRPAPPIHGGRAAGTGMPAPVIASCQSDRADMRSSANESSRRGASPECPSRRM